jgi:hypothetical protein
MCGFRMLSLTLIERKVPILTFDATNLNGGGLNPEQFGGLERLVDLLQCCER